MTLEMYIQEREEKARKEAFEAGREAGRKEGRKAGREAGRKESALEMVKRMLTLNFSIGDIIKISGWSEEKILQLTGGVKNEH